MTKATEPLADRYLRGLRNAAERAYAEKLLAWLRCPWPRSSYPTAAHSGVTATRRHEIARALHELVDNGRFRL